MIPPEDGTLNLPKPKEGLAAPEPIEWVGHSWENGDQRPTKKGFEESKSEKVAKTHSFLYFQFLITLTKRTINSPWSTKNDTNFISIVLFCISRWLLGCVALLWGEEDKDVRERDRFSIEPLPLSSTDCLDVLFFPRIISGERWHSSKHEDAVEVDYIHLTEVVKEGAMKTGRQMKDIPCHTTCLG